MIFKKTIQPNNKDLANIFCLEQPQKYQNYFFYSDSTQEMITATSTATIGESFQSLFTTIYHRY